MSTHTFCFLWGTLRSLERIGGTGACQKDAEEEEEAVAEEEEAGAEGEVHVQHVRLTSDVHLDS